MKTYKFSITAKWIKVPNVLLDVDMPRFKIAERTLTKIVFDNTPESLYKALAECGHAAMSYMWTSFDGHTTIECKPAYHLELTETPNGLNWKLIYESYECDGFQCQEVKDNGIGDPKKTVLRTSPKPVTDKVLTLKEVGDIMKRGE